MPRGFTVLEIIIASSIALIVFAIGYLAISTTTKVGDQTTKIIRDTENARLFFNMLERDLATALPGPGNIEKKRETLSQSQPYSHDAVTNPSPLVITESVSSATPLSDILQFYCRSDSPNVRDEIILVRYYVNRNDHTLCRATTVYDPTVAQPLPDYVDPKGTLTNASNSDLALFDNVRQLVVNFQEWRADLKQYAKESGTIVIPIDPNTGTYSLADSVLVTVIFTDDFKQKTLDAYNPDHSTGNTNYQTNLNKTYRSYSKVLQIPAAFKE
ncbi:MAG TPA: prepilin-type N-terminal cleavage/methylation domain-containing protein [Planctomycetota bacterium]|nr:prepilin-type N-terminal cleavage/methylation domain-containing protein [Planctomycetota bacterium]